MAKVLATSRILPTDLPAFEKAGGKIFKVGETGLDKKTVKTHPRYKDAPEAQIWTSYTEAPAAYPEDIRKLVNAQRSAKAANAARRGYDVSTGKKKLSAEVKQIIADLLAKKLQPEDVEQANLDAIKMFLSS